MGPVHDLGPFDGTLDYAGTSGATDSVFGAPAATTLTAPPPGSALPLFVGTSQIFLTLTATSFPLLEGMETEVAKETADATATVQLTFAYTPASTVPEPGTLALLAIGVAALPWLRRAKRR